MTGSANAITPSNSPERRERYLDVPYLRLDRAQDHSGLRSRSWGVARPFSIATMVTVSSRLRPAILEKRALCSGNRWGGVHFEPCCSPGGFADCVWAMVGVADRRVRDGRCPSVNDLTH